MFKNPQSSSVNETPFTFLLPLSLSALSPTPPPAAQRLFSSLRKCLQALIRIVSIYDCGLTHRWSSLYCPVYFPVKDVDETLYLALLVVGGYILLPILVITTLLRKSINKHPVYLNFCISWILFSIADAILSVLPRYISTTCTDIADRLYRTRSSDFDLTGLYSSITLCYVQASLSNGVQALWVYRSHRRSVLLCWWYVYIPKGHLWRPFH